MRIDEVADPTNSKLLGLAEFLMDRSVDTNSKKQISVDTFISLARKYGTGIDVDARWKEILEFEGQLMLKYGKKETIHG